MFQIWIILCYHNDNELQVGERYTPEDELVIDVLNYTNHPMFNISAGPIGGGDLAVYYVDEEPPRKPGAVQKGKLYPACLPSKLHKSQIGLFAGEITFS